MATTIVFPHHILAGYIVLWTVAELLALRFYPIRQSCKKISLVHCLLAFLLTTVELLRRVYLHHDVASTALRLYNFEVPGTAEHHIISLSMAYFLVDMPFCWTFHPAFILHHLICIVAFAAIQGYWKYLPEWLPFHMDFMQWESTPDGTNQRQLLLGGLNGVFNLWMAELGGVFFHINRMLKDTDMELPSRGLFLVMFTFSRCFLWPLYLWNLYSQVLAANQQPPQPLGGTPLTHFHKASTVIETALFLTNLHFLYKNIYPIYQSGRLMPEKPKHYHRQWLDKHPTLKRLATLVLPKNAKVLRKWSSSGLQQQQQQQEGESRDDDITKSKND